MTQGESVMVVEDDPVFADFVRDAVVSRGFKAIMAATAEKAIDLYKEGIPDVIVLDIVMPDMDGIEFIRWLAAQSCQSRLVVMTGFDPHYADNALKLALATGITELRMLMKPVRLVELFDAIGN